jgi:soluble lytic murein transglycosylase-like protein
VVPAVPALDQFAGWQTSMSATTCGDYAHSMTPAQRVAAAKWLLALERRLEVADATDGAESAGTFAVEIATACTKYYGTDPTTGVIAAAVMAYMDDPSLHPAHH